MAFSLTWLPGVLKDVGLKVAEVSGWENRGRGEVGRIRGVICHHTVGRREGNMPSLRVIRDGRPDLAGPLSQLGLGRDGTFFVIAAGRANHAGRGEWQGVGTGNSSFIGIEAENTGRSDDQPWPEVQVDAYARGCAAILKHIGESAVMCCGHKDFALPRGRKIDPTFDMDEFRARVSGLMDGSVAPRPPIPAEDDAGRPTLRRPASGDLVRDLQQRLGINVDGDFGPQTEAAVRRFQRDQDLVADGIVGPRTWAALMSG